MSSVGIMAFIIFLILLLGFILLLSRRKPRLTLTQSKKACQRILDTQSLDPAHSVLESHKIFVATLRPMSSKYLAAEIIQSFSDRFPNKSKVWQFHKLRNKIAHEVEIRVTPGESEEARKTFSRAIKSIV